MAPEAVTELYLIKLSLTSLERAWTGFSPHSLIQSLKWLLTFLFLAKESLTSLRSGSDLMGKIMAVLHNNYLIFTSPSSFMQRHVQGFIALNRQWSMSLRLPPFSDRMTYWCSFRTQVMRLQCLSDHGYISWNISASSLLCLLLTSFSEHLSSLDGFNLSSSHRGKLCWDIQSSFPCPWPLSTWTNTCQHAPIHHRKTEPVVYQTSPGDQTAGVWECACYHTLRKYTAPACLPPNLFRSSAVSLQTASDTSVTVRFPWLGPDGTSRASIPCYQGSVETRRHGFRGGIPDFQTSPHTGQSCPDARLTTAHPLWGRVQSPDGKDRSCFEVHTQHSAFHYPTA